MADRGLTLDAASNRVIVVRVTADDSQQCHPVRERLAQNPPVRGPCRLVPRAPSAPDLGATFPFDATDGESLLRTADRALYAAEAAGRNRVEPTA